mmetsp:Transcript_8351/g.15732  ORF Transcript_8351/g.15732 Transcript_8351/m.15732 type:complete len:229 (+) Transcript_8351:326-1012(+)
MSSITGAGALPLPLAAVALLVDFGAALAVDVAGAFFFTEAAGFRLPLPRPLVSSSSDESSNSSSSSSSASLISSNASDSSPLSSDISSISSSGSTYTGVLVVRALARDGLAEVTAVLLFFAGGTAALPLLAFARPLLAGAFVSSWNSSYSSSSSSSSSGSGRLRVDLVAFALVTLLALEVVPPLLLGCTAGGLRFVSLEVEADPLAAGDTPLPLADELRDSFTRKATA